MMPILSQMALYQTQSIRRCEQLAIQLGFSESELMSRAGLSAFSTLMSLYPSVRKIAVFCGNGNNAGDGYVLARHAHEAGFSVIIHQCKTIEHLPSAARHAAQEAMAAGVFFQDMSISLDSETELIVDALLGIGLKGLVKEPIATAIQQINNSELPILALDTPSGLDVDTGCIMGLCVRASATVTFIANKLGMMTYDGPDYCGEIICHDLLLSDCLSSISPSAYLLKKSFNQPILVPRLKNSHKGHFGHVLVIGGGVGMPGAIYLTAKAALRVGAGLVSVATVPEHAQGFLPHLPEAMVYGIKDAAGLMPLIEKATVCVIGPGLGESPWAEQLFNACAHLKIPLVVDASALQLLAKTAQKSNKNWVLTPHPGEAAKLLHCTVEEVQSDRYRAVTLVQQQYGGTVVLKGVGSLICTDTSEVYVCAAGNPGMATAGMGDVLSGVIGGLIAQKLSLSEAAKRGVWVHATAADAAAVRGGERGLLASDLMPFLRDQVNIPFTDGF